MRTGMMGRINNVILFNLFFIFTALAQSGVESDKYVKCLINHLNSLPNQAYVYEDGLLLSAQKIGDNFYNIDASVKVGDTSDPKKFKLFKCHGQVQDQDALTVVAGSAECHEESRPSAADPSITVDASVSSEYSQSSEETVEITTEGNLEQEPVKLNHEVQPNDMATSGEQFVAIRRETSVPGVQCIGCSSLVNPSAPGVQELAQLAVRHIERHEPDVRHHLAGVNQVERLVQVVNGVRYILTLSVDYNNCSAEVLENCMENKICKVSILEKPWLKLSDGTKFRAVVSNNCTSEWLCGDNGEVLPSIPEYSHENGDNELDVNFSVHNQGSTDTNQNGDRPTPDFDNIANSGSADEMLKVVHNTELQAKAKPKEKVFTPEELKHLEEQIISEKEPHTDIRAKESIEKDDANNDYQTFVKKTISSNDAAVASSSGLSDDKKQALAGFMDFFDTMDQGSTQTHSSEPESIRVRRNVGHTDERFVISLANHLVDHLNSLDKNLKSRKLLEVVAADEELVNGMLIFYVRAKISVPCEDVRCSQNTTNVKVCTAMFDSTSPYQPKIIKSFCKKNRNLPKKGDFEQIPLDDPEVVQLSYDALGKIESTSSYEKGLKIVTLINAERQVKDGTVLKLTYELGYTNCPKSTGNEKLASNECTVLTELGSKICRVKLILKRWVNVNEISYKCTEKPSLQQLMKQPGTYNTGDNNDPRFKNLAQASLKALKQGPNDKNKLKVIKVTTVGTRNVEGIITKITFDASYTDCAINVQDGMLDDCDPIEGKPLQNCKAIIHERPWLRNGKHEIVECSDKNKTELSRLKKINEFAKEQSDTASVKQIQKRSTHIVGGQKNGDPEEYRALAEEILQYYMNTSGVQESHRVVKILSVTTQVVAGSLTRISFIITPIDGNCELQQSNSMKSCNARVWDRPWLAVKKEINVTCSEYSGNNRVKKEIVDEDFMDEDEEAEYAKLAVKRINENHDSQNLQKLITVVSVTRDENDEFVKMSLEVAYTWCLKDFLYTDVSDCDEIEQLDHRTCHAKIYHKHSEDSISGVTVICDDQLREELRGGPPSMGIENPYKTLVKECLKKLELVSRSPHKQIVLSIGRITPPMLQEAPLELNFVVAYTNCSRTDKHIQAENCLPLGGEARRYCRSNIWFGENDQSSRKIDVKCSEEDENEIIPKRRLTREAPSLKENNDQSRITIILKESLRILEERSTSVHKQKVIKVQNVTTPNAENQLTKIYFEVVYTTCSKYDLSVNESLCEHLTNMPIRRCHSEIWERSWFKNGREIEVSCDDIQNSFGKSIQFNNAEAALQLAEESLKHVEAKYPHPRRQKVVRIISLEKQVISGIHYKIKFEVGYTDCWALSDRTDCNVSEEYGPKIFCKANIWLRPWLDNGPNVRVSCDGNENKLDNTNINEDLQARKLFDEFLKQYSRPYTSDSEEFTTRFAIFTSNLKRIHELNTHEKGTARYGVTRFADLSYEEFSKKYLGLKPSLHNPNHIPMAKAHIPDISVAESFDWRDKGAVTEVKNQGTCGSCWAFSVTGNIEGQWKLKTGDLISLSEQELVDCDKLDNGCDGGLPDNAYRAIEQLGGLETEQDYPYEGDNEKCHYNKTISRVQITSAVNISSNETDMAKWLLKNGPISIGINANGMQFYMGGVSHPWKLLCNPGNLDHGVLIVGYGVKNYPLFHKTLPYWIVKNSWGTSWGEQGYYRVFRGDGTCGLNMMASSAII